MTAAMDVVHDTTAFISLSADVLPGHGAMSRLAPEIVDEPPTAPTTTTGAAIGSHGSERATDVEGTVTKMLGAQNINPMATSE